MLSILNKGILQKKLQYFVTNNVFLNKKSKNTTTKQNIKHKSLCRSRELNLGTLAAQSGCVTSAPPSQLRVTIVVKLFNCFDAMGRNVKKTPNLRATLFKQIQFFCNILTCMGIYIWHFLIFTEVGFTV